MRLIDADMCIEELTFALWECPNEYYKRFNNFKYAKRFAEHTIKNIPTAQLKTGKWDICYDDDAPQDGIWLCSVCGYARLVDDISPQNYCPNCGAKMRGEQK